MKNGREENNVASRWGRENAGLNEPCMKPGQTLSLHTYLPYHSTYSMYDDRIIQVVHNALTLAPSAPSWT